MNGTTVDGSFFKRKPVVVVALVVGVGVAILAGVGLARLTAGDGGDPTARFTGDEDGSEIVYRLRPVAADPAESNVGETTAAVLRERLRALGVSDAQVTVSGDDIRVMLPGGLGAGAGAAVEEADNPGRLYFYDWEPNLIGPEKAIGGHPGRQSPTAAVEETKEEWEAAGRSTTTLKNMQLILSGAFPDAYGAVKLASEQRPAADCATCSTASPRYYLFSDDGEHRLLAGPEFSAADLYISTTGLYQPGDGEVIEIPVGTIVVSEYPNDATGKVDKTAKPGWYALKDNPALSGTDITNPKQEFGEFNEPNVSFGFTDSGREAFQEVTRQIAQRGQAAAIGPVAGEQAAQLSGHFAVILDNEVKTRPIINFAENPDGIDGRTGAQISGGFSSAEEARGLVATLDTGPLPMWLVRLRCAGDLC